MKYTALGLLIAASLLLSCEKTDSPADVTDRYGLPLNPPANSILVDASKDGGGWWFPQGPLTGFNAAAHHQGKALVDYLKRLGYVVHELPRGAVITTKLLNNYSKVIRASAFSNYTTDEIAAYESFLNRSSSLFLINDHLKNSTNDRLSAHLGLMFEGSHWGPINSLQSHPVTAGVSSVSFIAGSVIRNWDASKITVLGAIQTQSGSLNGSTLGAMGIVKHPTSKIFFIGDINGIEQVPQPFISNVVKWLFQ